MQNMEGKKNFRYSILILNGPSGAGKSTIINGLMKNHPSDFAFSISHTSREPRVGEVDGVNYYFDKKENIEAARDRGEFIETAYVHGNIYGTSFKAVNDIISSNKICILDIDVQGSQNILKKLDKLPSKPYFIWVNAPDRDELIRRLKTRGSETDETITKRLETMQKEEEFYQKNKDLYGTTIINIDIDESIKIIENLLGL